MGTKLINGLKFSGIEMALIIAFALASYRGTAQGADEALRQSYALAFQNKFEEALVIVDRQLIASTDNYDFRMLQARIHGWQSKYMLAKTELDSILSKWPNNRDALLLQIDLHYWSHDFEEMLRLSETSVRSYPDFTEFQSKRVIALEQTGRLEEANAAIKNLLKKEPNNEKFILQGKLIAEKLLKNSFLVSYRFSAFNKSLTSWHNTAIAYSRNSRAGSITARLNYGRQFSHSALQWESDLYPKFSRSFYGYANIGFSNAEIFPRFRSGAELFYVFPFPVEISAGMRYLKYQKDEVLIYTGTLGVYLKNYWLMMRPLVTEINAGQSFTFNLMARRYLTDKDHYLGLSFTRGNAPAQFVSLQEIQRFFSTNEGIEYQHKFNSKTVVKVFAEHQKEEYLEGQFRERFSGEVSLIKRF
jgi:YaiO family outer membrane protein